jgi:hypothetical protein
VYATHLNPSLRRGRGVSASSGDMPLSEETWRGSFWREAQLLAGHCRSSLPGPRATGSNPHEREVAVADKWWCRSKNGISEK